MLQQDGDTMTLREYLDGKDQFISSIMYLKLRAQGKSHEEADAIIQMFNAAKDQWQSIHYPELNERIDTITLPKRDLPPQIDARLN